MRAKAFLIVSTALLAVFSVSRASQPVNGNTTFGTGPTVTYVTGPANAGGIVATDVFGYTMKLQTGNSTSALIRLEDIAFGTGNGIDYYGSGPNQDAIPLVAFTISANNASKFDLQSFNFSLTDVSGTHSNAAVTLIGYLNGAAVSGATTTQTVGISTFDTFNVSANAAFRGINSFSISPAAGSEIGYLAIDNLNATNFVVPEPSTWAFVLGGTGLMAMTLRRRSNPTLPLKPSAKTV